jgi:hypothetical protein
LGQNRSYGGTTEKVCSWGNSVAKLVAGGFFMSTSTKSGHCPFPLLADADAGLVLFGL